MNRLLDKAKEFLRQYASDDENAVSIGCYNNPKAVVEEWIKELEAME